MGKLIFESYTKEGCTWLGKDTFFSLCTTVKEIVHKHAQLVIILTDLERKEAFLKGTEPLYGLSYVFKHDITDIKEMETKGGLAKEQKIIVLDDLVHIKEGLANDDGSKLWFLFMQVMAKHHPYQIGLDMHYYRASDTRQLVLPITQTDFVYLIGEDIFMKQTDLK